MIKFFRNLRKTFLAEGHTGKYVKYAVGEIVLVVIGILIALSINNWNESKKLKKEETLYLERLKIDLEKDTVYYNNTINRASLLIERSNLFFIKLYDEQKSIDEARELLSIPLWDSEYLTIQDNTYMELVSSGKLNIMSNATLKVAIVDFYRLVESHKNYIREGNEYSRELMAHHASNYPGLIKQSRDSMELEKIINDRMFRMEDFQFLNTPSSDQFQSFEDIVMVYKIKHEAFINLFKELKSRSNDLLYQIEQENREN